MSWGGVSLPRHSEPPGISSVIAGRPVPSSTQPDHTLPSTTSISYAGTDDEDGDTRPALDAKHLTLMTGRRACKSEGRLGAVQRRWRRCWAASLM